MCCCYWLVVVIYAVYCVVCWCVTAVTEREFSSRMLRQCHAASQQAEKPSRQRPSVLVDSCSLLSSPLPVL